MPRFEAWRARSWQSQAAGGLWLLTATVSVVAGSSLALFGIGGAMLLYGLAALEQRRWPMPTYAALGFGGAFLLLVMVANAAALDPARSWPMSWRLVSIVVPLLLLMRNDAATSLPSWFRHVPLAMLGVLGLLLLEILSGGQILLPWLHGKDQRLIYYNRGLSYAAVLIWPLIAGLWQARRRRLAVLLPAVLLLDAWCSASRGAPLALAAGAGFFLLASWRPGLARGCGLALLTVVASGWALMPWLFEHHAAWLNQLPPSWQHRTEIWDYLLGWYASSPWFGAGADATGLLPPAGDHVTLYKYADAPAAHPHQMYLQLLLELGPAGWLWGVVLAGWVWRRIGSWPPQDQAMGLACWGATLTLASGAFSLWSDSFWAMGAFAVWFCMLQRGQNAPSATMWLNKDESAAGH